MMDKLIQEFPEQLKEALQIGRSAEIKPAQHKIQHIFVAGMGGSGIGANFVAEFINKECKVPFSIGKGYDIPAYIGKDSLVIASSYSGNTEETLSAFRQMLTTGAKVVVVSSGGELIKLAKKHQLDFIELPSGKPSPRACLGYSLVQQLIILQKLELISEQLTSQIEQAANLLVKEQDDIRGRAERIAHFVQNKIPVIYIPDHMEAVALRLRQQINENSKMLGWHNVVPEMNHNELVGWRAQHPDIAVLFFRNSDDAERVKLRMDISKEVIGHCTRSIIELYSKGQSTVERAMYFVHLGDWLSFYLADLQKVDPNEIKVIDYLKKALADA